MMRYIGIGHSNLHPPARAMKEIAEAQPDSVSALAINLLDQPYRPGFLHEDGKTVANPVWLTALADALAEGPAVIYLCLGGSDYWRWSFSPAGRPFDFIIPDEDDGAVPMGEVVPYSLMLAHARAAFTYIGRHVEAIRQVTDLPLAQFLPPPPVIDLDAAMRRKTEEARQLIAAHGISSPAFRLKMWRFCARMAREACAQAGIECYGPPEEAYDSQGFLKVEYNSDGIHGNTAWGHLLCRRLLPADTLAEKVA